MPSFEKLTTRLREGRTLHTDDVHDAVELLTSPNDTPETKAEFLTALADKGETTREIAAFAAELRQRSIPVPVDDATRARTIIDLCGTGGDRLNTFNISTAVALLCAAAGLTVAKHGNRAITSLAGSADVLEALGIPVDLTPDQAAQNLRDHNFAFLFAPKYHPAFQHIAPARKLCAERGQRTIFNIMGPLLNPALPSVQLVGVPRPQFCHPVAVVLQQLGLKAAMVVCGQAGDAWLDELSTIGPSTTAKFDLNAEPKSGTLSPTEVQIPFATLEDLKGGDKHQNAQIIHDIFAGKLRGPKRDAVILNAAAALHLSNSVLSPQSSHLPTLLDSVKAANEVIDSGAASRKLDSLAQK